MKKILGALVLVMVVFGFCACKKKPQDNQTLEKESVIQKTCIRVSLFGDEEKYNSIKKIVANFEGINPDIQIEIDFWSEDYYKQLNKSILTGKMPDVVMVDNIEGFSYYKKGFFQNLGQYFLNQEDYLSNAIEAFSYDDCIWGVPVFLSPSLIIFNKNIFLKNNVELPSINWNRDCFLNKAHHLTSYNEFGFGFDNKISSWLGFLWSNGGGIIDNSGCIMLDSASSKEALQFYSNLKNLEGVCQPNSSLNAHNLFKQGKIAMIVSNFDDFINLKKSNLPFELGFSPFPSCSVMASSPMGVIGVSLFEKSHHKREAWRFILYLTNSDRIWKMQRDFNFIPAKKADFSRFLLQYSLDERMILQNIITNSRPVPVCGDYHILINKIEQQLIPLFEAEKNVDDVIDENFYKILQRDIK